MYLEEAKQNFVNTEVAEEGKQMILRRTCEYGKWKNNRSTYPF